MVHFIDSVLKYNKRLKTVELVGELRSLDIEDLTVDADFHKIDSLASRLENLASNTTEDELVTYAINGLSDKCDHVAQVILNRVAFFRTRKWFDPMMSHDETHMNRGISSIVRPEYLSSSRQCSCAQSTRLVFQDMEDAGWNMDTNASLHLNGEKKGSATVFVNDIGSRGRGGVKEKNYVSVNNAAKDVVVPTALDEHVLSSIGGTPDGKVEYLNGNNNDTQDGNVMPHAFIVRSIGITPHHT
ncbi:hypothetical protein Tco_0728100 [Tanacetum coccineum]|uniref:Uncharacterized protein n=1 Tax=Tanacetum coccineum TaxID=301880 RepID=A0ABQ4YK80_9ASTR